SGQILYDGRDLAALEARSVRRQIGIVTQHAYLFNTSIRDNIALTEPSLSLNAVRRAARLACIDEDVEAMAMGYETILVDAGASGTVGWSSAAATRSCSTGADSTARSPRAWWRNADRVMRGDAGAPHRHSGFFAVRTPLLPFDEYEAWGAGLEAPAALDAGA